MPYHFHNEYELTAILEGQGSRFVGNNIGNFENTDMVLVGKNLPHHWHNNKDEVRPGETVKAIVLKFEDSFNGIKIFDLPENYKLRQLLDRASSGIRIVGDTYARLVTLMQALLTAAGPERISLFLTILNEIASSSNVEVLSNDNHVSGRENNDQDRMNRVYEYIMANYLQEISLSAAASVACMNEAAFCKYFKKRYNKTFIQVISEIRISYACRELLKEDSNISDVCYQSGFNTVSNFTKTFRKITGVSPREYKTRIKKHSA